MARRLDQAPVVPVVLVLEGVGAWLLWLGHRLWNNGKGDQ